MSNDPDTQLRQLAESLASVSLWHLHPSTRERLRSNALSVNAYPTEFGGLVFVGTPRQRIPAEQDLDTITKHAELAGINWLLFDAEAPIVGGLNVFPRDKVDDAPKARF
ncbi:hypothetical protein PEC18_03880 [Paucibacter sp. O1-1]|nr:hypothetical protein [Paucibacter sp. O1-1]MDA3825013.1 hypothetical protein [Paucibacter sp. O1-1]